jgi:Transposase DDE domain
MGNWASTELQGANLGHERFRPNAIKVLTLLGENPGLSFSAACGPAVRKSASRLFSSLDIDLQQGHVQQTVQRCSGGALVLAFEDTTDVNYDRHKDKKGMGLLGGSRDIRGINIHSVVCASDQGEPLGLIGQYIWAPTKSKSKVEGTHMRKLPIEDKESMKWIRLMRNVNKAFSDKKNRVLVVADREGDFYEHFSEPRKANIDLLVRGSHIERNIIYEGQKCKVRDLPGLVAAQHTYKMTVQRQKDREEREAEIEVRSGKIAYPPPAEKKGSAIILHFVHAAELNYTAEDKIEWYLITSMVIENFEQARQLIGFYAKRWTIERFHYILKTGLKIEKIQIDTFDRLKNPLELYSIVAWRILWLAYVGKVKPQAEAIAVFEQPQIEILEKLNQKKIMTVKDFLLAMGKLVGFQTSTKQPLPGEKLLWLAYGQLVQIQRGFELAGKPPFSGTG